MNKSFTDQQIIKLAKNLSKRLTDEQKLFLAFQLFNGEIKTDEQGKLIICTGIEENNL